MGKKTHEKPYHRFPPIWIAGRFDGYTPFSNTATLEMSSKFSPKPTLGQEYFSWFALDRLCLPYRWKLSTSPTNWPRSIKKHPDSMTRWTLIHPHVMIVFSNSTGVMRWLINSKYSKSEFWCLFPSFPRTAVTSAMLCASWRPALQVANFMLIHATCSSNEKTYDQCLRKRFIKSSSWPSWSGHALGGFWRIAIFKLRWVPVKHIQKLHIPRKFC